MRLLSNSLAPLALAAALAGCQSNAVPIPVETESVSAKARRASQAAEGPAGRSPDARDDAQGDARPQADEAAPQGQGPGARDAASRPARSAFVGQVEGLSFVPTHNFFLRGVLQVAGEPEVVVFVQTDSPELCGHLGRGTMPRNTTMLAVALMHESGGDIAQGGTFIAPFDRGATAPLHAMSFYRHLDGQCVITPLPAPAGAEAEYGSATLEALTPEHARVRYAFTLNTGDAIEGAVDATYCDAPAFFERPESLMVADVDPADCK